MKLKWNVTNHLCFTHNFTIKCHRCCRWDSLVFESFESIIIIIMIMLTVSNWSTFILLFLKFLSVALRNQRYYWSRHTSHFLLRKSKEWTVVFPLESLCSRSGNYYKYHDLTFLKFPSYFFLLRLNLLNQGLPWKEIHPISKFLGCFKTTLPRSGAVLSGKNCRTGFEHHRMLMLEMLFVENLDRYFTL